MIKTRPGLGFAHDNRLVCTNMWETFRQNSTKAELLCSALNLIKRRLEAGDGACMGAVKGLHRESANVGEEAHVLLWVDHEDVAEDDIGRVDAQTYEFSGALPQGAEDFCSPFHESIVFVQVLAQVFA